MPAFFITKGKMFAYFWHHHHGDDVTAAIVKTSGTEEQAMLIEMEPDLYYRPPYFGPSGWVGIHLDRPDTDWDRVADRVAISWELVAPRRLLVVHGADDRLVPVAEARGIAAHAGASCRLEIIPGMGHFNWVMPSQPGFARVANLVVEFLGEVVPAR